MSLCVYNKTGFKFFVLIEKTDLAQYTLHIAREPISTRRVHVIYACPLMPNKTLVVPSNELDPNSTLTTKRHDFDAARIATGTDKKNNLIITVFAPS